MLKCTYYHSENANDQILIFDWNKTTQIWHLTPNLCYHYYLYYWLEILWLKFTQKNSQIVCCLFVRLWNQTFSIFFVEEEKKATQDRAHFTNGGGRWNRKKHKIKITFKTNNKEREKKKERKRTTRYWVQGD